MAIFFAEDWEWLSGVSTTEFGKHGWTASGTLSLVTTSGVNNSRYVQIGTNQTSYIEKPVPVLDETMGVTCSCSITGGVTASSATTALVKFMRLGTPQVTLSVDQDLRLVAYRGTTVLGVSPGPVPAGTWFDLECKIIVNNTTGYFGVRVNGEYVIQFTGDTLNSSDGWVGSIRFGSAHSGDPFDTHRTGWDNIILWDGTGVHHTDWIGRMAIVYLPVNGDSTPLQWTPSTGTTHYTLLDDVGIPVTTDFVTAGAAGLNDVLNLTDPPGNVTLIEAVIPVVYGSKSGSGPSDLALGFELTGTLHYGNDVSVPASNGFSELVYEVNPKTGSAWTFADLTTAKLSMVSK